MSHGIKPEAGDLAELYLLSRVRCRKDRRGTLSSPKDKAGPLSGQGMDRAGQDDLRNPNKIRARLTRCKKAAWSLWLVEAYFSKAARSQHPLSTPDISWT